MTYMTPYQQFIAMSRYARWLDKEARRETYEETVDRYVSWMAAQMDGKVHNDELEQIRKSIINMEVMCSMRALMTAGPALDRCHVAAYNCSYFPVDHQRAFDEAMYILMCGTGVGYSVEAEDVAKLPVVAEQLVASETVIVVGDSKMGWAASLKELIACLYAGQIPRWDVSKVRPAGARLKTFGGRASGPDPLEELFRFCVKTFTNAEGRRLYPIEASDLMCKIGDVVVVGGVRRSALICLTDLSDQYMQKAKSGNWREAHGHRELANISSVYENRPQAGVFLREWTSLYESYSGERGIFNRQAARKQVEANGRRDPNYKWGTNPCSEIILRPYQFCNLTEVVVRPEDTLEDLENKVRVATLIGTMQSTLTEFKYLRHIWRKNTEEERLLGVSLTGIMDHPVLGTSSADCAIWLMNMKEAAIETNKVWAEKLGIPQSTAITCVKPSGTVSQLVDSASGIHPRWSDHYIRRVRADNKDPMTQFLIQEGVPNEPAVGKEDSVTVFSFPTKAPKDCGTRADLTAIDHLNIWKHYAVHWCEHKPSITVNVRKHEWLDVAAWVYRNFDLVSGISFLPYDDSEHLYAQAPYEECDELTFNEMLAIMPELDWVKMQELETDGSAVNSKELACSAGVCEVVDIGG